MRRIAMSEDDQTETASAPRPDDDTYAGWVEPHDAEDGRLSMRGHLGAFLVMVMLVTLGWWVWSGAPWRAAERAGWIRVNEKTNVYVDGEWATGEYRYCKSISSTWLDCPRLDETEEEFANKQRVRSFLVGFYGEIEGTQAVERWECQRETDSVSCLNVSQRGARGVTKKLNSAGADSENITEAPQRRYVLHRT
jgi:hypothetical protein